jgi:fatty acid desaturase
VDNHNNNSSSYRPKLILVILLLIAGIYIIVDHGQHVLPYLPFTFLLGCLVMHLFMHGGHNGHSGDSDRSNEGGGQFK